MPDRIIRDEILESERWLGLQDNGRRLAYFALLLKADGLGNLEGHPQRLLRLWISFGINTHARVEATLKELEEADLVRAYGVGGKRFLHIPRFGQNLRYLSRLNPESPWTTEAQKHQLAKNSQGEATVRTPSAPSAHGRREVKRSEEKRSEVVNGVDKSSQQPGKGQNLEIKNDGPTKTLAQWAALLNLKPRLGEGNAAFDERIKAEIHNQARAGNHGAKAWLQEHAA